MNRRGARRPTRPARSGEPLVVLTGGPTDPRWLFPADWETERRCAAWSRKIHGHGADHPAAVALLYVETTEWIQHRLPEEWPAGGTVWRLNMTAGQQDSGSRRE